MQRLGGVFKDIKKQKEIFVFLLAFFFYIDGVYTIIDMATSYGKDVGISDNQLLFALLLTQVVAFPCAILFGRLSQKYKTKDLINVCIVGYFLITAFALQLDKAWEFWFLAVCVAMFQGAIQSLSRSYYAKIIPKEKSSEYFGFYDIFGKGASFTGTMLMGIFTQITGTSKAGVALICLMFILGFIIFQQATRIQRQEVSLNG
jgi:UMF1 family MFS transporter